MEEIGHLLSFVQPLIINSIAIENFSLFTLIWFFILIILLLFSALVSGSEIAFFSLNPHQYEEIENNKDKKNCTIHDLLKTPKKLLATILIANNFINVAIIMISTYLTDEIFSFKSNPILAFIFEVIVVTSLILLFGEIMPKLIASQKAHSFARRMCKTINFLKRFLSPLSSILVKSTSLIDKRFQSKKHDISANDLSEAIKLTNEQKTEKEENIKILNDIVRFGDIDVSEIMTVRVDITAINKNASFDELLNLIRSSGFSRIPVFEESLDKVIGLIHVKDILPFIDKNNEQINWSELLRTVYFVPENKKIDNLLREFQSKKIHLAIVVDEYGGTSGMVTLEDVLEEIVGDISDEFDEEKNDDFYRKIDDKTYIFEAKTSIHDLFKIIKIEEPKIIEAEGNFDSIGGLILEKESRFPKKNELIQIGKIQFRIIEIDNKRIKKVKIIIP